MKLTEVTTSRNVQIKHNNSGCHTRKVIFILLRSITPAAKLITNFYRNRCLRCNSVNDNANDLETSPITFPISCIEYEYNTSTDENGNCDNIYVRFRWHLLLSVETLLEIIFRTQPVRKRKDELNAPEY